MKVTFLRTVTLKETKQVIPEGYKADAVFVKCTTNSGREVDAIEVTLFDGTKFKTGRMSVFFKAPSIKTMEKWGSDGVAKTVTGKRCEPDGHGDDGSPSWFLVLGMI